MVIEKCLLSEHPGLYSQSFVNYPLLDTFNALKRYHGYDFALGMAVGTIIRRDHVVVHVSGLNGITVAMICKNKMVSREVPIKETVKNSDVKYLVDNNYLDNIYYQLPKEARYGLRRKRF